jgi:RNA polymerase sigma-70 factor, ECF subfamily
MPTAYSSIRAPLAASWSPPSTRTVDMEHNHPFTAVYQQHVERIYRYHLARTGSVEDAQDLTAETFRAALESFATYDALQGCAAAWLTGIAHHKLIDHFRRSRQTLTIAEIEDQPDRSASPEEISAHHLQMAQVAAALSRLPADRADALSLHFFAGLSLSETALVMRRSDQAVKKLLQRGLADLRRRLAAFPNVTIPVEVML